MGVQPVPDAPAAVARCDGQRVLVIADYHAGIEVGLRREGVELPSHAEARRTRVIEILDSVDPDRLLILGDLGHAIGDPWYAEREELETLLTAVRDRVPVTIVKGNHDGDVEAVLVDLDIDATVTDTAGVRIGEIGFVHGHTWPSPSVIQADVVCVGHEHPEVRLDDEVGGYRLERVWLQGDITPAPFREVHDDPDLAIDGELIVFPAFNELSGGTWVNVPGQEFLSPFLPEGLEDGEVYMLDGTRLGPFRAV